MMAKTSGGVRTYRQGSSTYRKRQTEVEAMRASGRYSSVEIGRGGGWLAIERSTARHKPEELEAARILADKGYKVILKDEAGSEKLLMDICSQLRLSKELLLVVLPRTLKSIRTCY